MGAAQFMPRSYRTYAVDGDGDGRRDLWGSWDDVIASVANYLAKHGWRAGEPVVVPAELWFPRRRRPRRRRARAGHDREVAARPRTARSTRPRTSKAPALFIRVDGDAAPELRAGFHNFGVITRYNRSILYALAVNDLGRRIESPCRRGAAVHRRGVGTMRLHCAPPAPSRCLRLRAARASRCDRRRRPRRRRRHRRGRGG